MSLAFMDQFICLVVRAFAKGPVVIQKAKKKWYLIPPCLTLSIKRYGSRVKSSNPGKGVAPFHIPRCSSHRKESLRVTLNYGRQLLLVFIFNWLPTKPGCTTNTFYNGESRTQIETYAWLFQKMLWTQPCQTDTALEKDPWDKVITLNNILLAGAPEN